MSYLDTLLPRTVTVETLRHLLAFTGEQRIKEGLFFEFKEEIDPEKGYLPKTVAAFANASGGFLLWGAAEGKGADKGYLIDFPGVLHDKEPALRVSNEIQQISPLPVWNVEEIESPSAAGKFVVVVRVEKSKRPPHINRNGVVYRRTPGGSSDPITDRAMLDRLVDEGREAERLVGERLTVVNKPFEMRGDEWWRIAVASVPVPVGSAPRKEILTLPGFELLWRTFAAGNQLSGSSPPQDRTIGEDYVELAAFPKASVRVFDDGSLYAWRDCSRSDFGGAVIVPVSSVVVALVREVLANQAGHGATTVRVALKLGGMSEKRLADTDRTSGKSPPDPWRWEIETQTPAGPVNAALGQLERRLWRSAGVTAYEPE